MDGDLQAATLGVDRQSLVRQFCGRLGGELGDGARGLERGPGGAGVGVELLGQEVGGDAVAGVLSDDAPAAGDLRFEGGPDVANEAEVDRAREPPRERPGGLQVGEQDGGGALAGLDQAGHPLVHRPVTAHEQRADARGDGEAVEEDVAEQLAARVVDALGDVVDPSEELVAREVEGRGPQGWSGPGLAFREDLRALRVEHHGELLPPTVGRLEQERTVGAQPPLGTVLRDHTALAPPRP
jgi:hypothetical protein